jgi:PST family polysaccharide transporter
VLIILGKEYLDSVIVLKILCWLPFIISISNVYGIQILLSLRKDKKFLNVVIFAAILSIILSLILTSYYKEIGTAITILIIEIFVSVSMLYLYKTVVRKNEI